MIYTYDIIANSSEPSGSIEILKHGDYYADADSIKDAIRFCQTMNIKQGIDTARLEEGTTYPTVIHPKILDTHMGGDSYAHRHWTWNDFLTNFVKWHYEDGVLVCPISYEASQDDE